MTLLPSSSTLSMSMPTSNGCFSEPTADDYAISSVFHQFDTQPSASAACVDFEEWLQLAEEAADTFMDDLFESKLPPHELNAALESQALLGYNLPPPAVSHPALEDLPQAAAAIHVASSSNIMFDPQEVASSSTSINNPNTLDLKNIIVKKPVLDRAVERLGGGKKGAQRLWGFIQIWLQHQNISSRMELPLLSNTATNQSAAPPTSPEKLLFHESNVHVENAAFSDVIGPAMDAVPTSAPVIVPGNSVVLRTNASALVACESPTVRSRATSSATAARFRAARKRRMARKRKYLSHHYARPASSLRLGVSALQTTGACHDYQHDAYSQFEGKWE